MSSDLQTRLTEAEKSFKKACEQIVQLNRRLDEMAKRYDKASRENHRSFRYSLRLRMAVTEGVRNMYYEYAANKADEITNLRCQVLQEVGDGNQPPTDGPNRAEEEEGGGGESNPIADLEGVGEMLDNRMLNDSGASYGAMQEDEEEEEEEEEEEDMQEDPVGLDQDSESNDAEQDNESNDVELPVPSPDNETEEEEEEEDMVDVISVVEDSHQLVRLTSPVAASSSSWSQCFFP